MVLVSRTCGRKPMTRYERENGDGHCMIWYDMT